VKKIVDEDKLRDFLKATCLFSEKEIEERVEYLKSVDEKEIPVSCKEGVLMIWVEDGIFHSSFMPQKVAQIMFDKDYQRGKILYRINHLKKLCKAMYDKGETPVKNETLRKYREEILRLRVEEDYWA